MNCANGHPGGAPSIGLEKCTLEKPVVVESPWAVLCLYQNGVQAASLLGTEMTAAQEARLEAFPIIQLALDNDEKGRAATEKITERLREKHKVIRSFLQER
jgi:DNA primase